MAVSTSILRIIQEALINIRKHAKATRVGVDIVATNKRVDVKIQDNGIGFDPGEVARSTVGHYGLLTMQERAHIIDGELTITSHPGKGTMVRGSFPTSFKK